MNEFFPPKMIFAALLVLFCPEMPAYAKLEFFSFQLIVRMNELVVVFFVIAFFDDCPPTFQLKICFKHGNPPRMSLIRKDYTGESSQMY